MCPGSFLPLSRRHHQFPSRFKVGAAALKWDPLPAILHCFTSLPSSPHSPPSRPCLWASPLSSADFLPILWRSLDSLLPAVARRGSSSATLVYLDLGSRCHNHLHQVSGDGVCQYWTLFCAYLLSRCLQLSFSGVRGGRACRRLQARPRDLHCRA